MTDSWDERRQAQEDSYFDRANKESLARLARKQAQAARLSPVTGQPMEQIVAFGAIVDRCTTSGGIWLDAGELDEVLAAAKESTHSLKDFIGALPSLKPSENPVQEGLPSPINGKPMTVEKVLGISIARCAESGGIWLDARELDRLISSSHQSLGSSIKEFFGLVLGKK
jgi:Zn-finger nucleic acid-binding protein